VLSWAVLIVTCVAAPAAAYDDVYVIPPGHESFILDLVGGDTTLPGDCRLGGVSVERSFIAARFVCGAARQAVEIHLRHPDSTHAMSHVTEKFAIEPVGTAAPPPSLLAALEQRIRSRENGWNWAVRFETSGRTAVGGLVEQHLDARSAARRRLLRAGFVAGMFLAGFLVVRERRKSPGVPSSP
jgi:hypothetical protein